ncbi:hypothetical protein D4764_08G0011180 [Takifugu flavidus]|uniref:Uncharacterized protein n=1 Tax=Takifugu flavidus TaxID=433684 RepID=A0A5C6MSL8_9TELE|nr:hypothetical protein D4764_08G0011180 [Takifugu flavidus]
MLGKISPQHKDTYCMRHLAIRQAERMKKKLGILPTSVPELRPSELWLLPLEVIRLTKAGHTVNHKLDHEGEKTDAALFFGLRDGGSHLPACTKEAKGFIER